MLPNILIPVSLLLLLSLPTNASSAPLSALPLHPLSFPLLHRQAISNRPECNEFCRHNFNFPACFDLCDQYFPDQSPNTTDAPATTAKTASTTDATATATTATGALTPVCALYFPPHTDLCLTVEESKLARLINDYRVSLGLARLPVSKTLSTVALVHTFDSQTNSPFGGSCNLHSWSDACSLWTAVTYSPDHTQAEGMWRKPAEINTDFAGNGHEISAFHSAVETAEMAFDQWQRSSGHNAVITKERSWGPFGSMDVGIFEDNAHAWFADEEDPAGRMTSC